MRYRDKTTFEAVQWNRHGDHPAVEAVPSYFRAGLESRVADLDVDKLGWIQTPTGPSVVYPGNWIIERGGLILQEDAVFKLSCEPVDWTEGSAS